MDGDSPIRERPVVLPKSHFSMTFLHQKRFLAESDTVFSIPPVSIGYVAAEPHLTNSPQNPTNISYIPCPSDQTIQFFDARP
jgi:hypothetical protein